MMSRRALLLSAVASVVVLSIAATAFVWWRRPHVPSAASSRMADTPPAASGSPSVARADVVLDTRKQQLIGVRTVRATRSTLAQDIRAVGIVRSDETRVVDVNVKIDGWIRTLSADYTGRFVRQGDELLTLYSPDLLAAEREYLLALNGRDQMRSSVLADAQTRADALASAARQRLALWDVSADDLAALEQTRQPADAIAVRAPASGFVVEKTAIKGAHVTPGQTLLKIADLSEVWVEADVYAQDMALVRPGAPAIVTLDAYPADPLRGRVLYISPDVDNQTRTNKVRFAFPNPRGRLKPGMYATVDMRATGATGITVPADAVLDSGREQIVFLAKGDGRFTPRSVTIGRRVDGTVEIVKGLDEGDEVASAATFFVDSESQLRGALQSYDAPTTSSQAPAASAQVQIVLRVRPDPPRAGDNEFEASVMAPDGTPITDAEVTVQLFMPAMPAMNMPAISNEVKLRHAGGGIYKGTGQVMTAGRWEATVMVTRAGQPLGSVRTTVAAR